MNDAPHEVLSKIKAILLDFDGPVCSVFAGSPSRIIADHLKALIEDAGSSVEPVRDEGCPLAVLRFSAFIDHTLSQRLEEVLRRSEREAVLTAAPTEGARELLLACRRRSLPVVIVSNNSAEAIGDYLALHDIAHLVDAIVGRDRRDASLMKPNPHLLTQALNHLGAEPSQTVLIGDSVTDAQAAHAAGTRFIGYANKPHKPALLAEAGSDAIVESIVTLIQDPCFQ